MTTTILSHYVLNLVTTLSSSLHSFSVLRSLDHHKHLHNSVVRTAQGEADRISDLPGLNFDLKFEQFSGYLDVSESRHVFYWFIESQSEPTKDPVVLWTK